MSKQSKARIGEVRRGIEREYYQADKKLRMEEAAGRAAKKDAFKAISLQRTALKEHKSAVRRARRRLLNRSPITSRGLRCLTV